MSLLASWDSNLHTIYLQESLLPCLLIIYTPNFFFDWNIHTKFIRHIKGPYKINIITCLHDETRKTGRGWRKMLKFSPSNPINSVLYLCLIGDHHIGVASSNVISGFVSLMTMKYISNIKISKKRKLKCTIFLTDLVNKIFYIQWQERTLGIPIRVWLGSNQISSFQN